jgi:TIR domain
MTTIFVSYTTEDMDCAEHIRLGLEAKGYTSWREPSSLSIESILYPRTIENVILGSSALVLVWSDSAARSDWVERHLLFAQQVQKPILPVLLDGTALPNTVVGVMPINSSTSCVDAVAQLLPLLPPLMGEDPLLKLAEQAAHQYIRERKAAIDAASAMLPQLPSGRQREAVLAILEYLAHNDLMDGVREKAREALTPYTKQAASPAPSNTRDSRHTFGVRCKNGHVSYFDRIEVCTTYAKFPREIRQSAGQELDEVILTCDTCGVEVSARVDCSKYRNQ